MTNNKESANTIRKKNIFTSFTKRSEFAIIIVTIIFGAIVQIINPVFLSYANIMNTLRSAGFMLIIALGMNMVMISGGIDLSVGSVFGLGGVIVGECLVSGMPIWSSMLLGVGVGVLCGFINGLLISKFRIAPLMITLGMYYSARGMVYILTKGTPVFPLGDAFQQLESSNFLIVPNIIIIAAIFAVIFYFIMNRTTYGRSIYAIGGNIETAKVAGINTEMVTLSVYTILGALAAFSGVFTAARLGSAQVSAGTGYELQVIAAVVIGGTSPSGGKGNIVGTIIGVLFLKILSSSMTIMRVSAYWQDFTIGAVLVVAVLIDSIKQRNSKS